MKKAGHTSLVASLFSLILFGHVHAGHEDLWVEIDFSEYLDGVRSRETLLRQSSDDLTEVRTELELLLPMLAEAETRLKAATVKFADLEKSPDESSERHGAWEELVFAHSRWISLANERNRLRMAVDAAENDHEVSAIVLEKYRNDYEAQSDPFAVHDRIARCGSLDCSAADFLNDERFAVFQPHVLEMVGAHHAYARGLTGHGVRIGIDDDIVNYRIPEFAGRISFDGAVLTYPVPYGDDPESSARRCDLASASEREALRCQVVSYDLGGAGRLVETLAARWTIAEYGWPGDEEEWFLRNDAVEEGERNRWSRLPHGGRGVTPDGGYSDHGTIVASVAAGRDFGVAPGATIIPIAKDFSWEGQSAQRAAESSDLARIRDLPEPDRQAVDYGTAQDIESNYEYYDIINRSFGIGVFDPESIAAVLDDETQWWGEQFRNLLPQTWRAFMQTGVHPDERTIVVYAAGNETEEYSGLGADLPYYEPHVRGSQLAVMAVGHDGFHAEYSNFCGPLPPDWDAARWGRHYCLAAPGTVNAVDSWGQDYIYHETVGTSFAAPVVSGAIALLMEHFRGQLGNVEIVKRVLDTADNTGLYAQLEIYGAGLLDLEAALQPVGDVTTGTPSLHMDAALTLLGLPPAIGGLGQRLADQGVEVASLDSLGAPFWSSPARFMHVVAWTPPQLIPSIHDPGEGGGPPHLGFTPGTVGVPVDGGARGALRTLTDLRNWGGSRPGTLRLLTGEERLGVEWAPGEGYRWGVLKDGSSWLGSYPSGAFGNHVRSTTSWFGRSARFEIDGMWSASVSGTVALADAVLSPDAMLEVDSHIMSTWDIGVERGVRGSGRWSRISLSQPLRAETGKGTLTYLGGLANGVRFYDRTAGSLAPDGRELAVAFTHEMPVGWGRGVVKIAQSFDFLHEPGSKDFRIGLAWRMNLQ